MATVKTKQNDDSVEAFINNVQDEVKRQDSHNLLGIFTTLTGHEPKMWGTSIIGFGSYHYTSERSSQEADWPLIGFSPRKQNLTIYIMPGFDKYQDLLKDLGRYKTSVSCLYVKKLADVDISVLQQLIQRAFADTKQMYPSS